ncbi:MAG: hypothetical protein H0X31_01065 [Nostocaceae cyanobacterium]|nr:hypothetical protein [Nostocaceae cyanobacterium]
MIQRWIPRIIVVYVLLIIIVQPVFAQSSAPKFIWTKLTEDQSSVISISPNGKQIVFGSPKTNYLTLIDWETKHIIWQVPLSFSDSPDYRAKSNWSPDGKYIATLTDKLDIYVFNAFTGEHITKIEVSLKHYENLLKVLSNSSNSFNGDGYTDLKWNANGQQLAVMAHGYIVVYDLSTAKITTVVDLVGLRVSSDLHNYLSWFDWSPDGSKFAAFHARLDDKREGLQAVQPIEIVMGFWNKYGDLLSADESQNSRDKCVPNGQGVFQGATVDPLGVDVVWAPDSKTIAVSSRSYVNQSGIFTVCTLHDDGTISTKLVSSDSYPKSPTSLHWTIDQKWLIGIADGCSLMIADVSDDFRTHLEPLSQSSCGYESSWSQDDHYVAVGGFDGISVGTVEFPK